MAEKENSNSENTETKKNEQIREYGQTKLEHNIHLLSVIGEIERDTNVFPPIQKLQSSEHVLPQLAAIEDSSDIQGLLVLLNTVGGDVEAGLAIAEMIASIDKPTVSLVLGGSHSIGVPIAVSTDYSFIVPSPERWSSIRSV